MPIAWRRFLLGKMLGNEQKCPSALGAEKVIQVTGFVHFNLRRSRIVGRTVKYNNGCKKIFDFFIFPVTKVCSGEIYRLEEYSGIY